jgi:5'-nucleotidase
MSVRFPTALLTPVLLLLALAGLDTNAIAKPDKIDVCHILPDHPENVQSLRLSPHGSARHIAQHDGDYEVNVACSEGIGECRDDGFTVCVAGDDVCTATPGAPPEPTELSCDDGLDNDCDGEVDECPENESCSLVTGMCEPTTVELQILAINDFHGNIATSSGSFGGTGRADYLAANIAAAEAGADNSIFVSAGDLIGASPLLSALFHDEPTIEAMNLLGLDINGVGHHEFDEGPDELLRMAFGGSHPVDGDLDGDGFAGADFEFLAANVVVDATGDTLFEPYTIRNFDGADVAFIGVTLEGTPSIVKPTGVAGLTFDDEAATVNSLIPELQLMNIESIVVLLHEGGFSDGGQNDCGSGLTGPIAEIVPLFDDAVDLVIAGHTNDEFVCEIDGKWVTMADNRGRLFTEIDVTLNQVTKDMTVVAINNVPNLQGGVTPDPTVTALIDKYETLAAPLANTVVGTTTTDILRTANAAGESALGDIIADAQLEATEGPGVGSAVVAFANPGGIRNDIIYVSSGPESDSELTFGEAFGIQPFGNSLVTMTLTGAQIHTLLEQQWVGQTFPRILQVSDGFTYTWDAAQPDGSKVDASSIRIGGVLVNVGTSYRVTVNSFLATGGDGFSVLVDGTDRLGGEVDLDALVSYFGSFSPVAPGPQDRITRLN